MQLIRDDKGHLTEWVKNEMKRERAVGATLQSISHRYGVTEGTVRRYVGIGSGLRLDRVQDKIDPSLVRSMVDSGASWSEVGRHFQVSDATVRRVYGQSNPPVKMTWPREKDCPRR